MAEPSNIIPFKAEAYPIRLLRTRSFDRDAGRVFSSDEVSGFLNYISANPDAGDVMKGTGGLRKIRWAAKESGKRGGARIIYYFRDLNIPLLLLAVYAKSERATLKASELKSMERKVEDIVRKLSTSLEVENNQKSGQSA